MPAGKYSFYLHSDDRTDMLTAATINTVSKPRRGDFLRTVATAGAALYQIDARLPGLLTELFDGKLKVGQLTGILAVLSGRYTSLAVAPDEAMESVRVVSATDSKMDRRRFTLVLSDNGIYGMTVSQLESVSARLRGQLLRSLIVAGCALYTLDPRFPQLLTSLPVLPAKAEELATLAAQLTGLTEASGEEALSADITAEHQTSGTDLVLPSSRLINNMRKIF
ncbi:plasmid partitioning/stability family protein [Cronobacter dublinensis]